MQRILRCRKILLCGVFPDFSIEEIDFEKYKEARGLYIEDPWERVKSIFSKDEFGYWHPELMNSFQSAQVGGVIGLLVGGIIESKKSAEKFFRTSDANIYASKKFAYKALHNEVSLGIVKGAFKWAPGFAICLGAFSLISSCSQVYRNKIGITDHFIAGAACGGFYKFMFGIKGMISGGIIGGILGAFYGATMLGISKLAGTDCLELKYSQYALSRYLYEKRHYEHSAGNKDDEEIIKSGLHVRHVTNPINILDDKEEEKSDVSEKKT